MFIIQMKGAHPLIGWKTVRWPALHDKINAPLQGGISIRTVLIRVPPTNLAAELAAMRAWLDKQKSEPLSFACKRYGSIVAICVEFDKNGEAEAFKSRFDGAKRRGERDALLLHDTEWTLSVPTGNTGNGRETMAQACWWRLMAEEVRAEADGFNSSSARQTMRIVAQTWDRLAEDLERRLARSSR
jgi:hypothetical protein